MPQMNRRKKFIGIREGTLMAVTYPKILLSIFACIYFACDVFASQIPIGHVMQKTVVRVG